MEDRTFKLRMYWRAKIPNVCKIEGFLLIILGYLSEKFELGRLERKKNGKTGKYPIFPIDAIKRPYRSNFMPCANGNEVE